MAQHYSNPKRANDSGALPDERPRGRVVSTREEWKQAYGAQRRLRGRALYVSRNLVVTEALRKVMPPVVRIQRSRMMSGKPASCAMIYPPK